MIMKTATSVLTALLATAPLAITANDAATTTTTTTTRRNEYVVLEGHTVREQYHSPLPYTYIQKDDLPDNFDWRSVDGVSYTTHSLNQVRTTNRSNDVTPTRRVFLLLATTAAALFLSI